MIITDAKQLAQIDFLEGVTLLVDKPIDWTSFDVVNKLKFLLRKKLNLKKFKIGHAGTLDPLATGLLIIAIGRDTKKIESYQQQLKRYTGTMKLGATTISYDAEFEPNAYFDTKHITAELIEQKRKQFIGIIEQVPPAFSALKVDGKRAFKMAREGKEVVLKSRQVEIFEFELNTDGFPDLSFEVCCSKGTYIRSLVYDFGKVLESGAFLTSLQRTAIGEYQLTEAFSLEDLVRILA